MGEVRPKGGRLAVLGWMQITDLYKERSEGRGKDVAGRAGVRGSEAAGGDALKRVWGVVRQ